MAENILLNKKETARLLRVSLPTLDRMVVRGDIPIVKLGKNARFKAVDLARYINDSTKQNGRPPSLPAAASKNLNTSQKYDSEHSFD